MPVISDPLTFVKAGRAVFTVRNENTGNRFTYKVTKGGDPEKEIYFVKVLTGNDNVNDYRYIGIILGNAFRRTKASKLTDEAQSVKVFKWFIEKLVAGNLPEFVKVYHEGRCGRCGRTLTVPESIESGYGPECIGKVFG